MSRTQISDSSAWPSLALEGNLIASAAVAKIAAPEDNAAARKSYGIRQGLSIREEMATAFRVGQSHYNEFAQLHNPSPQKTRTFIRNFLKEAFGFDDLQISDGPVAFISGERIPIVVVPPSEEKLDHRSYALSTERQLSPALALQNYLNKHDEALWGLVSNGRQIWLMRDNASLTRPAYIEADIEQIFTNEDFSSFCVQWLLIHRTRFGVKGALATDCELERTRDKGARDGEVARDRLAGQVKQALVVLGTGFLEANPSLASKLNSTEGNLTVWFNELLRFVYRLIFLMVAEDRDLLHPKDANEDARKLYADGYSLTALRTQCRRRTAWDKHFDRYEGIKIVFHALARGEKLLGIPSLGGLFSEAPPPPPPQSAPTRLRNRALMEAIYRLSWLNDKSGMVPVNWREMQTEELGSVYESLLELQPQIASDGKSMIFANDATEKKGNQRKTTGSYYTPDSLVQELLNSALDPVLNKIEHESNDPGKDFLELSVIDPACGSGHFLLGAARRIATRLAKTQTEGAPSLTEYRQALRDTARCCIYGVDINPMAVELTKVALWIETVNPGHPLGFFDEQIRCGDSLVGLFDLEVINDGIPDGAYKPLAGDAKSIAKHYKQANQNAVKGQGVLEFAKRDKSLVPVKPMATDFSTFRRLPEDSLKQIEAKSQSFIKFRDDPDFIRAKAAADLYVAAFLLMKTGDKPMQPSHRTVPTSEEVWQAYNGDDMSQAMEEATKVAKAARVFHWPLEFPDIMQRGGFDVVLGNPPWEVMKITEVEYFSSKNPTIASLQGDKRKQEIKKLKQNNPLAFGAYQAATHQVKAGNEFIRACGRFELTGKGSLNSYALFAEHCASLSRSHAGIIVPTGIAVDLWTAPFFAAMMQQKRLAKLFDFENRAGLFPAVDSRAKFSLLTLGRNEEPANFAFFLTDTGQIIEPERNLTFSPEEISNFNPNTLTTPIFRSKADARLTAKVYSKIPILVDEKKGNVGNIWNVKFLRMFDMESDSRLFRTSEELSENGFTRIGVDWIKDDKRYIPLFEAKMVGLFDHRASGYESRGNVRGYRVLPPTTQAQYRDPNFDTTPFYWIPVDECEALLTTIDWKYDWLFGFRKTSAASNQRTFISTVFTRVGVGDNMPLLLPLAKIDLCKKVALFACMSSLVFDFIVRQKMGGLALTHTYVRQLPVLPPDYFDENKLQFITPRFLELTYTSHSIASFARDLGHSGSPYAWDEGRRALLRADLDAFYARAYGLDREELRYILNPADVKGAKYPSETFRVLMKNELKEFGEYRSRRLILAAWDRIESQGEFAAMDM